MNLVLREEGGVRSLGHLLPQPLQAHDVLWGQVSRTQRGRGRGLKPQGNLFLWEQKECRGREPGGEAPPLAREKQGGLPGRSSMEGGTERMSKS